MDAFARMVENVRHGYLPILCDNCGDEGLSPGEFGICRNCESLTKQRRKVLALQDNMRLQTLDSIRVSVSKADFDTASSLYDTIITVSPTPSLLYAKGLMLIESSNYELGKVSHGRSGFMEANLDFVHASEAKMSEAKRLIAKSLFMSKAEIASTRATPDLWYNIFLCELKMGNMKGADNAAKHVGELDPLMLGEYSKLLLLQESRDYRSALAQGKKMLESKTPPANVFYYVCFDTFKTGNPKQALSMLAALKGLVDDRKIDLLEKQIRDSMST